MEGLPYDNATAFAGISLVGRMAQSFCVHPSVPANTLAEFLDRARPAGTVDLLLGLEHLDRTPDGAVRRQPAPRALSRRRARGPGRGDGGGPLRLHRPDHRSAFLSRRHGAHPRRQHGDALPTRARGADYRGIGRARLRFFSTDASFFAPAGTPEPVIRRLNEALRAAISHPERARRCWPRPSISSARHHRSLRRISPPRMPSGARSSGRATSGWAEETP